MTTLSAPPRLAPSNFAPSPTESPWTLAALGDPILMFAVHGTPAPQGSKNGRAIYKGKGANRQFTGKVAMQESSKKVKPWRRHVAQVAAEAAGFPDDWMPLTMPLVLDMVFTMPRPKSFPANDPTGRRAHGKPTVYPDVSKLVRSTEDAMTKIVWRDDAQVIAYRRCEKVYVGDPDPDALRKPGAVIRVWNASVPLLDAASWGHM